MSRPRPGAIAATVATVAAVTHAAVVTSPAARWRWQVAARTVTAIAGGYALTALASATLAVLAVALGLARVDAALAGMLASFAVYGAVIVWSYGAATLARLWATLALVTAVLWVTRALALAFG